MPFRHRLDADALRVESFSADSGDDQPRSALVGPVTTLTYEGGYTCRPDCPTQLVA